MNENKLILYDDKKHMSERYLEKLKGNEILEKKYDLEYFKSEEFKEQVIKKLQSRVKRARNGNLEEEDLNQKIDECNIFIIDYDLIDLSDVALTGDEIAYLLRYFSKCDFILGLNKHGFQTFDLTLKDHIESPVDLYIGKHDLDNSNLWKGNDEGYRPWYWPSIIDHVDEFEERKQDVLDNLHESILDVLGFSEDIFMQMPTSLGDYLGFSFKEMKKASFEDFFQMSPIVLKSKDKESAFPLKLKARIIAARFSKFLETEFLHNQNMVVDAPHLVLRFPSLLRGEIEERNSWNDTTKLSSDIDDLGIDIKKIEEFKFDKEYWISRPVWFWSQISECEEIPEVNNPWKREELKEKIDYVFAEDYSKFFKVEKCRSFVSKLESPYKKRYVRGESSDEVNYKPKNRLYLG